MTDDDKKDPRPSYYNRGGIECQRVIEAWSLNFSLGSALKYLCRAGYKDNTIEDLQKARQYLTFEIARREGKADDATTDAAAKADRNEARRLSRKAIDDPHSPYCTAHNRHAGPCPE